MATESSRDGSSEGTGEGRLSTAEQIKLIAAHNARADLNDDEQLLLFLKSWWSRLYNRPLKDPLLNEYTLEELLYEFYDRIERRAAEEERKDNTEVKEEEAKEKEALDWAEQQEQEELAQLKAKAAAEDAAKKVDPTKDPENIKWMEEQMKLAKAQLGEDFGEDIEESF